MFCFIYFSLHHNSKIQLTLPVSSIGKLISDNNSFPDSTCAVHTQEVSSTTAKIHVVCLAMIPAFHINYAFDHGKRFVTPNQIIHPEQPEFIVLTNLVPSKKYLCEAVSGATTQFITLPAEPVPNNAFAVWIQGVNAYDPLPLEYSCLSVYGKDAPSPPLKWVKAPIGTREFMLTFTETDPLNGIRYAWVLYNISRNTWTLEQNTTVGIAAGTDGGGQHTRIYRYWPPCSAGEGWRPITLTLYALSTSLVQALGNSWDTYAPDAELVVDFVNTQNIYLSRAFFSVVWCHYDC